MHRNIRHTLRRYYAMGLLDRAPPTRDVREDDFDFATEEERQVYEAELMLSRLLHHGWIESRDEKHHMAIRLTPAGLEAMRSPI